MAARQRRGWMVELETVQQILGNPLHPYTQILKTSILEPDPEKKWSKKVILSSAETEEFLRSGCKFAARCPKVIEVCKQVVPKDAFLDGRLVKCHLYETKS